ncbi:T9SS type A sorting domain-containing protein [Candidatus Falkowbacteria bacterium]|jgi:hypothetical protein|nr:T9SS type A sorting domain-containing protein [Candidatus Falkowbacteria bacterium]
MKNILFFLLLLTCSIANGQYSFEKIIKNDDNQSVFKGVQNSNGDFYIVGRIGSQGNFDAYIIRISSEGEILTKVISNQKTTAYFQDIRILDQDTILLIGHSGPANTTANYNNMWFAKMNMEMEILDQRFYHTPTSHYHSFGLNYSLEVENGNIIVAGAARDSMHTDLCTVTINQNLDTLAVKFYPYLFEQMVDDWIEIPNTSEYLMAGGKLGLYGTSVQAIRFDSLLNIVNIQNLPIDLIGSGSFGNWISDDTYLITSTLRDTTGLGTDDDFSIAVQIVDTAANVLKHKYFGKPDTTEYAAHKKSTIYINDTTIYVGGYSTINAAFYTPIPTYFELYMIDNELNLLGYSEFGGDANYTLWGIIPSNDGGCLMYGTRYGEENGPWENDIYIRKVLREDINIITTVRQVPGQDSYKKAYPNPACYTLNIPLDLTQLTGTIRLQIIDLEGRKIFDKQIAGTGNSIEININTLQSGMYLYTLLRNEIPQRTGKFIKQCN